MVTVPEVERAHHPPSMQELLHHDTNNPIIVATAHWRIWVCHDDTPPLPVRDIDRILRLRQGIWMVYAAIECRVIVYRRYREAVVSFRWAAHLLGRIVTQLPCSLHLRKVMMLGSSR